MQASGSAIGNKTLATVLGGLEAGIVGALWMLAWLGVGSLWLQRSFWAPENLMATAFDRNATLAPVFSWATCAGLALYLLIYGIVGAIFAAIVRDRLPRGRIMLTAIAFGLAWYYFSFGWMFKFVLPLVALLHVERATVAGHLVFGLLLGRYPVHVDHLTHVPKPPAMVAELQAPEPEPAAPATDSPADQQD